MAGVREYVRAEQFLGTDSKDFDEICSTRSLE